MEPNQTPPSDKKKSSRLGWILGAAALFGIIAVASGSANSVNPTQSSGLVPPSAQTAAQYQQLPQPVVAQPTQDNNLSNNNYYVNSDGNTIHSPAYSNTVPAGATARCGDGTYSFSQHRSGTCSHHGGVASWL